MFSSVDLPLPMLPTIDTNSPRSIDRLTPSSTSRRAVEEPNDLPIPASSMNAGIR